MSELNKKEEIRDWIYCINTFPTFAGNNLNNYIEITPEQVMEELKEKNINEIEYDDVLDVMKLYDEIQEAEKKKKKMILKAKAENLVFNTKKRQAVSNELKQLIFNKYQNKCAICGLEDNLEIHHKNENPCDNRITNLILLCPNCHAKIHG